MLIHRDRPMRQHLFPLFLFFIILSVSLAAPHQPSVDTATSSSVKDDSCFVDSNDDDDMSDKSFFSMLETRVAEVDSLLCVGLDPHFKEIFPGKEMEDVSEEDRCDAAYTFCKTLVDATAPYTACYKPNAAFFEALGPYLGMATLKRVIKEVPSGIPILLDAKRGDIGSTASAYADACYELGADAVTLSPLMGWDSVSPFVTGKYADKGAFVLCKTSNPGSNEILALHLKSGQTVFERIAQLANTWSNNLGLVVGATDAVALDKARRAAGPNTWILAPGVGAQGGSLEEAARAGLNPDGSKLLIPVSRGVSQAQDPAAAAKQLQEQINQARADRTQQLDAESIQSYQKEFLEFSLAEGVLKFGSFVLKSGRTSPYFFNAGLFATGGALYKLGKAYAAAIVASGELTNEDGTAKYDVVFGPAYKGISLGAVVCAALYSDFGIDAGFAYNRKEAKDHGEGGVLVGASMKDKRVLIVDDVITAGTAIRESHSLLNQIEAKPVGVVIALDRAEKRSLDDPVSAVQAVARDLSIPVVSIVSLPQLQVFIEKSPNYDDSVLASVSEYRTKYGV